MSGATLDIANGIFYATGFLNYALVYKRITSKDTFVIHKDDNTTWVLGIHKGDVIDVLYESQSSVTSPNRPPVGKWVDQEGFGTCAIHEHYVGNVGRSVLSLLLYRLAA